MRAFLDIGSHRGQTLAEIVNPGYGFDRIYAFEPMAREFNQLVEAYSFDPRVTCFNYGLSDRTGTQTVYGTNDICEASVYPTKNDLDASVHTECFFMDASEWFAHWLDPSDTVIVKMNCEGSEVPILSNLIDSGELSKITTMTFDLDIRRVAGREGEAERLLERLGAVGFDRYQISSEAFVGDTHAEKIHDWLDRVLPAV